MCVGSFLICFWQFYFLTQNDGFGKGIDFAWRPFLPIFKMVLIFGILGVFKSGFLHTITILCV